MSSVKIGASLFKVVLMDIVLQFTVLELSLMKNRLTLWLPELLYIVYEHAVRAAQRVVRASI